MKGCHFILCFLFSLQGITMSQPTLVKAKLKSKIECMSKEEMTQLIELLSQSNDYLQQKLKNVYAEIGYPEQERLAIKDELLIIKHKIYGASFRA